MLDNFISFIGENIVLFDVIFFIIIVYFAIQCLAKGFFLSLISFLKWVLALIITIILVPKFEPYISNYIDNQYVVGIGLGIGHWIGDVGDRGDITGVSSSGCVEAVADGIP